MSSFRIDPDTMRVVYLADRNADQVFELFAVPLDASASPRRLNRGLPAGGDVQSDFISIPGGRVLFRADLDGNDVFELFLSFLGSLRDGRPQLPAPAPTRSVFRQL